MPPTRPPSSEHAAENALVQQGAGEVSEGGHHAQREAWMARRRGLGAQTAAILARARIEVSTQAPPGAELAPPAPPGLLNWTAVGPSAVGQGQAFGQPVVSGRVLGIEVAPGSTRAYAGMADGGIWRWTQDATVAPPIERWEPQDDFVTGAGTPAATVNALSVGDIAVNFGATADGDLIFVGTGEAHTAAGLPGPRANLGVPADFFGVGVRVSLPVVGAGSRIWTIENVAAMTGQATFRLALDTDDPTRVWAATTAGIFLRPAGGAAVWPQLGVGGANPLPAGGLCTDIKVGGTTAAANKVVWVAVDDQGVFRTTDNGVGATWALVPGLPVLPNPPGRISLAIDESLANPTVIYALTELGQLFRFDTAADVQFRRVQQLPAAVALFNGQGNYDNAVAVAPGMASRVFIAGGTVQSARTGDWQWELAAYRSDLTNPAANTHRFGFTAANGTQARASGDGTYIGRGVHADAHCFAFGRDAAGNLDRTDVWIGSDGGVYRSTTSGNNGTFTSLNTGLATIQLTYIDQHPTHESVVLGGCQDNGVLRHTGHATWLEDPKGDGGGTTVDQTNPFRMMAQTFANDFYVSVNAGVEWRRFALPVTGAEAVPFYTQICSAPPAGGPPPPVVTPNPGWALIPTHRVWATWDWGTTWVTLPTAAAPPAGNALQDSLDGTTVVSVLWATPTRIYAATQIGVFRLDFNPGAGTWNPVTALGAPPGLAVGGVEINDIAVGNPATDDIYVCLNGAVEHVWWFNQGPPPVWVNTNSLATFNAPAEAIEVDPRNPLQVWVGTDVGVFQGIHTPPVGGAPRLFGWTRQSNGLPEAGVTDLQAQANNPMLRAATHGRGLWELPLGVPGVIDPDLFLRMNPADSGRRRAAAAATSDPTRIRRDNVTQVAVDWGDCPDLKLRRGIEAQPTPAFPGRLRLLSPRMKGDNVRRWQRHAIRRGFDLRPGNDDADFGTTSEAAAREVQRRYGLVVWNNGHVSDGIVGQDTWAATVSYPPLPARIDHRAFVTDVREDYDEVTSFLIGDATGNNRVFLQLHNRGSLAVAPADVRTLLLLARPVGAGNPPDLPAGWDARIRAADATAWTGASWGFADPGNPYRSPVIPLTAREPQVVEWVVDFQARGFAAGDTVIMLAFLTTVPGAATPDLLASAEVRVRNLIAAERRVAARRVRLDAVAVIP